MGRVRVGGKGGIEMKGRRGVCEREGVVRGGGRLAEEREWRGEKWWRVEIEWLGR